MYATVVFGTKLMSFAISGMRRPTPSSGTGGVDVSYRSWNLRVINRPCAGSSALVVVSMTKTAVWISVLKLRVSTGVAVRIGPIGPRGDSHRAVTYRRLLLSAAAYNWFGK